MTILNQKGSPRGEAGIIHLLLPVILVGGIIGALLIHHFHPNFFSDIQNSKVKAQVTQPNIVVIMTDDQDYKSLARMPYLTSLPQGKWMEFTQTYTNFPLCCPSRSTFLTGQYSHNHNVNSNNEGPNLVDTNTLATWLQNGGYTTGFFGKYLNSYPWAPLSSNAIPPGWSHWVGFVGSPEYTNYTLNENGVLTLYGAEVADYSTDVLRTKTESWVATAQEPFFAWFTPKAPHSPHQLPLRHKNSYLGQTWHTPNFNEVDVSDKPLWVRNLASLSASSITAMETRERKAAASLLAVDEALQGLMTTLSNRGVLDNTVIIFVSDNGYSWGAHRFEKKICGYDECARVPLLIRYPGLSGNQTDNRLVSNIDLAPTIAELAQVTPGLSVDGVSLKSILDGQASAQWRDAVLLHGNDGAPVTSYWGVRSATHKYLELTTGEKELYDLVVDPYELDNVANQPAYSAIQSQLALTLNTLKGTVGGSNGPSLVTITNPVIGAFIKGTKAVKITVNEPAGAAISSVELLVDDVAVGSSTTPPYTISWNSKLGTDGPKVLTAKLYDTLSNSYTSEPIDVIVDNTLPVASISSPTAGSIVSGTTMIIDGSTDASGIKQVKFQVDGVTKLIDTSAPFEYSWDTTTVANGSHTLKVIVTDMAGNVKNSTNISVTVQN